MTSATPDRPMPNFGLVFGGMMLLQVATTMAINSPAVLGPVVLSQFGIAPGLLGVFVAIIVGGSMTASLMAGTLLRRYGAVRSSQLGALLMAAALVTAATGQPVLVLMASIGFGLGLGPLTPASTELLAKVTPFHRLSLVFSIRQSGLPVGIAMTGIVLPALLLVMNWQGTLLVMAASIFVLAIALQPLRAAVDGGRDPATRFSMRGLMRPVAALWGNPAMRGLALCVLFYGGAQNVLLVYVVSYLTIENHYSLAAAGVLFAVVQASAIVFRIGWGWIADRIGDTVLVMGVLGLASSLFLMVFAAIGPEWPTSAVTLLLVFGGATLSGWNGLHFAIIAQKVPKTDVGTVTGAMQVFGFFGALAGPFLYAMVISFTANYASGFLVFSVLMLPAGMWVLFRLRRRFAVAT